MDPAETPSTSSHRRTPTSPHWPPLALWLALQLVVLLIPVTQTPLTDQFPRPAERQALYVMAAAQLALSALLFPVLFRAPFHAIAVIASTWPLLLLSGLLASAPAARIALAASYISAWLLTLSLWNSHLRSRRAQHMGMAAAAALVLGGPLLLYLRAEFGTPNQSHVPIDPIACAFALIDASTPPLAPWYSILVLAVTAVSVGALLALRRRLNSHRRAVTNSAPSYPQPDEPLSH